MGCFWGCWSQRGMPGVRAGAGLSRELAEHNKHVLAMGHRPGLQQPSCTGSCSRIQHHCRLPAQCEGFGIQLKIGAEPSRMNTTGTTASQLLRDIIKHKICPLHIALGLGEKLRFHHHLNPASTLQQLCCESKQRCDSGAL